MNWGNTGCLEVPPDGSQLAAVSLAAARRRSFLRTRYRFTKAQEANDRLVLLQPAIAYLHEAEGQFQNARHMLCFRPHLRLRPALRPLTRGRVAEFTLGRIGRYTVVALSTTLEPWSLLTDGYL